MNFNLRFAEHKKRKSISSEELQVIIAFQ